MVAISICTIEALNLHFDFNSSATVACRNTHKDVIDIVYHCIQLSHTSAACLYSTASIAQLNG